MTAWLSQNKMADSQTQVESTEMSSENLSSSTDNKASTPKNTHSNNIPVSISLFFIYILLFVWNGEISWGVFDVVVVLSLAWIFQFALYLICSLFLDDVWRRSEVYKFCFWSKQHRQVGNVTIKIFLKQNLISLDR